MVTPPRIHQVPPIPGDLIDLIPRRGRSVQRGRTRRRILNNAWFYYPCIRQFAFLFRNYRYWIVHASGLITDNRLWYQRGNRRVEIEWSRGQLLWIRVAMLNPGYERYPGRNPDLDLESGLSLGPLLEPYGYRRASGTHPYHTEWGEKVARWKSVPDAAWQLLQKEFWADVAAIAFLLERHFGEIQTRLENGRTPRCT